MNYYDVFQSRINHLGTTTAERIRGAGIRSFEKWLAQSPHTVRHLHIENSIYFDGIIIRHKDKEYEKIMLLHVSNDVDLHVGNIIEWTLDDASLERWIVIQEEKKVNGTYRTFWIIRCNYLVRWIDEAGHIQESWCYTVSSVDSKIKGNYRTWHNLISPQPNKYAEILMPRYPIQRSTNFIIEDESWQVIEYDYTSVPGTIYLSLTEDKINSLLDDIPGVLADTDKLSKYTIALPEEPQIFAVGTIIHPTFTLMRNGEPSSLAVKFISADPSIAKYQGDDLVALGVGTTTLQLQLIDYPNVMDLPTLSIIVVDSGAQIFDAYIEGSDFIRLACDNEYKLVGLGNVSTGVHFYLDLTYFRNLPTQHFNNDEEAKQYCEKYYAKVVEPQELTDSCHLIANDKNNLTPKDYPLILKADYNGKTYTKEIEIRPLW